MSTPSVKVEVSTPTKTKSRSKSSKSTPKTPKSKPSTTPTAASSSSASKSKRGSSTSPSKPAAKKRTGKVPRVDITEAKTQLEDSLKNGFNPTDGTPTRLDDYWLIISLYLTAKLSKEELDSYVKGLLGQENCECFFVCVCCLYCCGVVLIDLFALTWICMYVYPLWLLSQLYISSPSHMDSVFFYLFFFFFIFFSVGSASTQQILPASPPKLLCFRWAPEREACQES